MAFIVAKKVGDVVGIKKFLTALCLVAVCKKLYKVIAKAIVALCKKCWLFFTWIIWPFYFVRKSIIK